MPKKLPLLNRDISSYTSIVILYISVLFSSTNCGTSLPVSVTSDCNCTRCFVVCGSRVHCSFLINGALQ